MAEVLLFLAVLALICVAIVAATGYGVYLVARSAKKSSDRVRSKISLTVPASAVARQPWWYLGRIDHCVERSDYARRISVSTPFADEVADLAARIEHGGAVLRRSVRSTKGLAGVARTNELNRIEAQITELETAAASLVDLAVTAAQRQSWSGSASPAADVLRRTQVYLHALAELDQAEFGDAAVQEEVRRAAEAAAAAGADASAPGAQPALGAPAPHWVPPLPHDTATAQQPHAHEPRRRGPSPA